jgi:lantibiotic modifying enzyme
MNLLFLLFGIFLGIFLLRLWHGFVLAISLRSLERLQKYYASTGLATACDEIEESKQILREIL